MRKIDVCKHCNKFRAMNWIDSFGCEIDGEGCVMMELDLYKNDKLPENCKMKLEQIMIKSTGE